MRGFFSMIPLGRNCNNEPVGFSLAPVGAVVVSPVDDDDDEDDGRVGFGP